MSSTKYISLLNEQKISTTEDMEEMEAVAFPKKSEKPEINEFKSDISNSDTAEPYVSDEQQNDEENFKKMDVSIKI